MTQPAIVIPAYNRVPCLQRLLGSLADAVYPAGNIPLIISIDKSDNAEVKKTALDFQWKHGNKEILEHDKNLGLKEHILQCGQLTEKYGALILLEDDLLVSPFFYEYALKAVSFYKNEENVAGISLYSYDIAENRFFPFYPVDDGSDIYFIQMASSWGQVWTKEQWLPFRKWLNENPEVNDDELLPDYIFEWSKNSWKKHYVRYLIHTGKYFVFPRLSLTTNFEEPGTHANTKGLYQVTLQEEKKEYRFKNLSESKAVYDTWFEIKPECLKQLNPNLNKYDFSVDLYGTKNIQQAKEPFLLTVRNSKQPVLSFGMEMIPNVLNVVYNIKGETISLSKKEDVTENEIPFHKNFYKLETVREKIFKEILDERLSELQGRNNRRMEDLHREYIQKIEGIYSEHNKSVTGIHARHHDEVIALHDNYGRKISEEVGKAIQTLQFNLEYPLISIVTAVNDDNFSLLEKTVNSVVSQKYPRLQYVIVDATGKNLAEEISKHHEGIEVLKSENHMDEFPNYNAGFQKCTGDIMGWIAPGSVYFNKSFHSTVKIFKKFIDVTWITGTPASLDKNGSPVAESNLSSFRWNARHFMDADISQLQNLGRENIFWKRYLWEKAGSKLSTEWRHAADLELYSRFFHHTQLYTALVYFGGSNERNEKAGTLRKEEFSKFKTRIADGMRSGIASTLISKTLYPFYRINFPVLRSVYFELNPHPEIIRFDYQSGSFYLSKF